MQTRWIALGLWAGLVGGGALGAQEGPAAHYRLEAGNPARDSMVTEFTASAIAEGPGRQWLSVSAVKGNGQEFAVWMLSAGEPARGNIQRYIFQAGKARAKEYRHEVTGEAVLPAQGGWEHLLPRPIIGLPEQVRYLGHAYKRAKFLRQPPASVPATPEIVRLRPDLLIGQNSNTRQKDMTRRFDGSEYELIRLTRDEYRQMHAAGITCVAVDAEQWPWAEELGLFYWSNIKDLPFPESLYRSQYLGPALYLDEPAVGTRDRDVRPRLAKDPEFRRSISPQSMLEAFGKHFEHSWREGGPAVLMRTLRERPDVDPGDMNFLQENIYSWETMISTAAHELSQDPRVPEAIVFEPPGRIGTRRTLPEMNMTYGVQLPPDDPKALSSIILGFLRGAARATGKQWGISIYGAFEQGDAPWWLTHAYDLGATRFFFWDNYQLACVPFPEVLTHARHLREYARRHPRPALSRLRAAGEVAILLPPGYDLGHTQTGKGNLWGIHELNLERVNRKGVKYRTVMSNFFQEIERTFKQGAPFDLLWDLPGQKLTGYREVVRVREDGTVEVNGQPAKGDRTPPRAGGTPPRLTVTVASRPEGAGMIFTAKGRVEETAAPVYYTYGGDDEGVYRNALVAWELYGPEVQDQVLLTPDKLRPKVVGDTVEVEFPLTRPGKYRLRASTVDTTGRTAVVWTPVMVP